MNKLFYATIPLIINPRKYMSKRLNFIKYPGGSFYLAPWIVENMPVDYEKMKYVETHLGGGSVFFYKKPSITEILNDLNADIVDLFRFVRDQSIHFQKCLKNLPYDKTIFDAAVAGKFSSEINTYIKYRMSRGGLGKHFAWSNRFRGGKPGDCNAYFNAIDKIPLIQDRLKNTIITNIDAKDTISNEDVPNTLFFCDPPFLKSTRVSKDIYGEFEYNEQDHFDLSIILNRCFGKVMLLGYESTLYDRWYPSPRWRKVTKDIANNAGQTKKKSRRTAVLWLNY